MADDVTVDGPTPRESLVAVLDDAFPNWLVVPVERTPDSISTPAIIVKQRTIKPLAQAPLSHFEVGFFVTVVDEHQDFALAEPALDRNVLLVWAALMASPGTTPQSATKALFNNTNLSYDIETTLWVEKAS